MTTRACIVLVVIAVAYSLIFMVPEALLAPGHAQLAVAVLMPVFAIAAFACVKLAGLARLSGLSCARGDVRRILRKSLPYAPVLVLPVANIILAGKGMQAASLAAAVTLVCAALVEELCFRGLLMGIFTQGKMQPLANVALTSAIFACAHLFNAGQLTPAYVLVQVIMSACIGVVFGFARLGTDSLFPSMVAHGLMNATACSAKLYNETQLWAELAIAIALCAWSFAWWRTRDRG